MRKFFTQILTVIGFVVMLVGCILNSDAVTMGMYVSLPFLVAVLAAAFVFAKNSVVKYVGYAFSAFVGAYGAMLYLSGALNFDIVSIGMIIMLIPAMIHAIIEFFGWCGFTRKKKDVCANDLVSVLNQYKNLESENILSAEEFDEIKTKLLKGGQSDVSSIDDLKKWKKLLDQQIITAEEFSSIKAKAFNK